VTDEAFEVLIVGGGPVGHAMALQLGRAGISTLLVERKAEPSVHPKALGVHARTMEFYRQWGLADRLMELGLRPETAQGFAWMTRIDGIELGRIMFADDLELLEEYSHQSSERMTLVSQLRIEQVLAEAVAGYESVEVRFDAEMTDLRQEDVGVQATLLARSTGERSSVRARYVVAADGVRSPTRGLLGITDEAQEPYGQSVNVYFRSVRLDEMTAGRPYILWWIVNAESPGTFWPMGWESRWIYNFEADLTRPADYADEEFCAQRIRSATGARDLDVEIVSILRWDHECAVANDWRRGRVFLVGDAAHRFPPHGGFGLNTGIQDTVNLAWKLIAVLQSQAGDSLLSSYQPERRQVARFNADQTTLNTKKMAETGWLSSGRYDMSVIEEPEGASLRQAIGDAVPKQRDQLHSQGQQFGTIYESSAVIPDGRPPVRSSITEYRMTSTPGARVPHAVFCRADGTEVSTQGLLDGLGFVLLTGSGGRVWEIAAREAAESLGLSLTTHVVGGDGGLQLTAGSFEEIFEISPAGVVVVRPDGHVCFRATDASADATNVLGGALRQVLGVPVPGTR
jgi:2-polyprenyl-6-methoxyphenol hydroxylase-like FAD-dependent oxidoreductase